MTVQKGNIKVITPTNRNSSKQHDEPIRTLAITCSLFKSRVQCVIAFGFASHWLKTWREIFRPVIKCSNRIPRNNFRQSFEKYIKHHQNPWSYEGDSAIPSLNKWRLLNTRIKSFAFLCLTLRIVGGKVSTKSLRAASSDCFPSSSCLLLHE